VQQRIGHGVGEVPGHGGGPAERLGGGGALGVGELAGQLQVGAIGEIQQAAEHGGAEHGAGLVRGLGDRGGGTGLLGRHGGEDEVVGERLGRSHPCPQQREGGQEQQVR